MWWQASRVPRVHRPVSVPAPLLVLGGIASVQTGAAVATRLFDEARPGGTVLLRLGLSALLLLTVARPVLRGRSRADLGWAVAFGLVLAGMNATFYEALDRIPLGLAVTVEFVGPLTVAVLGSRRPLDLLWVALAAAGVALPTAGGSGIDVVGVLLALVAGAFWGGYILLAQRVGRVFPGASGLSIALTVGAVAVLPFGVVAGGEALLDPSVLGRGLAVAVLSSAVPYSLELAALRRMRASVFGVLMSLEPAFAGLSGLVLLGQHLTLREWLAVGCVTVASVGATRGARDADVVVEPGATPTETVVG
jgi:inner membrane transporter RhtA